MSIKREREAWAFITSDWASEDSGLAISRQSACICSWYLLPLGGGRCAKVKARLPGGGCLVSGKPYQGRGKKS